MPFAGQNRVIYSMPRLDFDFEKEVQQRTLKQNRSLHKYCELLAEAFNDAGLDMKKVLKPEVEIPWTKYSAKEYLWRPIQLVMTGHLSTAEAETVDYGEIYKVLDRHLAQKFGVSVAWPSLDEQSKQAQVR